MWLERLYDEFTQPGRMAPAAFLGITLLAFGVLAFVVGTVLTAMTGGASVLMFAVGFALVAFGALASLPDRNRGSPNTNRACPRCGAPPRVVVSAHGFTKCAQCGEPYFVS